ncbi:hypothetical protein PAXRUDRAFT_823338 [Paxillus rubicundulus Ve08.2h10]|uniref:Uncharacterized protein n=1 Tax=Paxillus rubicundulus Ve08.2h10 TaxID=930991 RepID=A0A0D0DKC0_9AGAM|nr:hypothetical protein PAXRUDRAFT_823338 [Paxillus rubicundulus Ve08.2h10]
MRQIRLLVSAASANGAVQVTNLNGCSPGPAQAGRTVNWPELLVDARSALSVDLRGVRVGSTGA